MSRRRNVIARVARDTVEVIARVDTNRATVCGICDCRPGKKVACHRRARCSQEWQLTGRVEEILLAVGLELTPVRRGALCCARSGRIRCCAARARRRERPTRSRRSRPAGRIDRHRQLGCLTHSRGTKRPGAGTGSSGPRCRMLAVRRRTRLKAVHSTNHASMPTSEPSSHATQRSIPLTPGRFHALDGHESYGTSTTSPTLVFRPVVNEHLIRVGDRHRRRAGSGLSRREHVPL